MVWYGMVWYGIYDVLWCGIWHGALYGLGYGMFTLFLFPGQASRFVYCTVEYDRVWYMVWYQVYGVVYMV